MFHFSPSHPIATFFSWKSATISILYVPASHCCTIWYPFDTKYSAISFSKTESGLFSIFLYKLISFGFLTYSKNSFLISPVFKSLSVSREFITHIWFFARLAATLYLFFLAASVPSLIFLKELLPELLSTMVRNMTSLSSPWKWLGFPHKILCFSISASSIFSTIIFWISSDCSSPKREITPKELPSYSSSSRQDLSKAVTVWASVIFIFLFSSLVPETL